MKVRSLLTAFALLALFAPAAAAEGFHPPLGDLYLSFDPTALPVVQGIDRYRSVAPFTLLEFYLLVHIDFTDAGAPGSNADNGVTAWEASVAIPAGLTITSRFVRPAESGVFSQPDNWIVGTAGICVQSATMPFALVTYGALLLTPANDLRLTLGPSTPSTFDDPGSAGVPTPGWLGCPPVAADLYPFTDRYLDGWIEINPSTCVPPDCPIPTEQESWGAVKSRFSAN